MLFNSESKGSDWKAWYRKYRPKDFDDGYIGENIAALVRNRFTKEETRPSVILIHGDKGCGKTTFMRFITRYYVCEMPKEDGRPCGECNNCKEIAKLMEGEESGIDCVYEVDATTANGKESIQNIMQDAMLPPLYGGKKILIFDECHEITKAAQNSLLKMLEDIPQHLVVLFGTTNPERLLDTIISRCQLKIAVEKPKERDMVERLLYIASEEGVKVSKEALMLIVKHENRTPRDCINLLEDLAKHCDYVVTVNAVKEYLKDSRDVYNVEFFRAAKGGLVSGLEFVNKVKAEGITLNQFMDRFVRFVMDTVFIVHGVQIDGFTDEDLKSRKQVLKGVKPSQIDSLLKLIDDTVYKISQEGSSIESINEMNLLRLLLDVGNLLYGTDGLGIQTAAEEAKSLKIENARGMKNYVEIVDAQARAGIESLRDGNVVGVEVGGLGKVTVDLSSFGEKVEPDKFSMKDSYEALIEELRKEVKEGEKQEIV